jgi:hypothetical protein
MMANCSRVSPWQKLRVGSAELKLLIPIKELTLAELVEENSFSRWLGCRKG